MTRRLLLPLAATRAQRAQKEGLASIRAVGALIVEGADFLRRLPHPPTICRRTRRAGETSFVPSPGRENESESEGW